MRDLALVAWAALSSGACLTPAPALDPPAAPRWRAPVAATPDRVEPQPPEVRADDEERLWTLERLVQRALAANRELLDAGDSVTRSRYSLRAVQADFQLKIFPRAIASVGDGEIGSDERYGLAVELEKLFPTGTRASVAPGIESVDGDLTSALRTRVTQPLLRGNSREYVRSALDAAQFVERTAERSLHRSRRDTVLATLTAAYRVVEHRARLELAQEAAARLAGHAAAARARERAGIADALDVYRATLQAGRAQDALDAAREGSESALDALRVLLALPLSTPLEIDAPLAVERLELTEVQALELALARRVELDQAEDTLHEARRRTRIAREDTLPDLDLSLAYTRFGSQGPLDQGGGLGLGMDALSVSLQSSSDLARRAEHARYEATRLAGSSLARDLELVRDRIVREVRGVLRDQRRSAERIAFRERQIAESRSKLAVARVKFDHGLASNFDVIEAEAELSEAQAGLLAAVVEEIVGQYRLRASLGTLVERGGPSA